MPLREQRGIAPGILRVGKGNESICRADGGIERDVHARHRARKARHAKLTVDIQRSRAGALSVYVHLRRLAGERRFVGYGDGRRAVGNGADLTELLRPVRQNHRHRRAQRQCGAFNVHRHQPVEREQHQRAVLAHGVGDGCARLGVYRLDAPVARGADRGIKRVIAAGLYRAVESFDEGVDLLYRGEDGGLVHRGEKLPRLYILALAHRPAGQGYIPRESNALAAAVGDGAAGDERARDAAALRRGGDELRHDLLRALRHTGARARDEHERENDAHRRHERRNGDDKLFLSVFFQYVHRSPSVVQRVYRLHLCRLVCRIQPEAHADRKAEQHRDQHDRPVHFERDVKAGHNNTYHLQHAP